MDIRQIEFVDAVARHGNFTRAANELHVAQPAVSAAIRHLEDELGVRLFERTSRHVALTDAGEAFLSGARRVMAELSDLSDAMREFGQGTRGVLRTSWWHQTDPQMVRYLSDYTTTNPGVEVSIVEWSTSESLAGLRRGELDLAMVALPDSIDLTGLSHTVIRHERYALVVTQDHRLADRDSVSVGDLANERFIVTRPGTGLRSCFDYVFAGRRCAPDRHRDQRAERDARTRGRWRRERNPAANDGPTGPSGPQTRDARRCSRLRARCAMAGGSPHEDRAAGH